MWRRYPLLEAMSRLHQIAKLLQLNFSCKVKIPWAIYTSPLKNPESRLVTDNARVQLSVPTLAKWVAEASTTMLLAGRWGCIARNSSTVS